MFHNSTSDYPYASRRTAVYARKGMVATTAPKAAQIGLSVLQQGGNAIDAAIATAAALTVLEPTSNGIGGDAFALVWIKGELYGLNASGPAPMHANPELIKAQGFSEMPLHGWIPVTVPGCPSGWVELSKRFGKLPLIQTMQGAIDIAREGFVVSPTIAAQWQGAAKIADKDENGAATAHWREVFLPNGVAPKAGDIVKFELHANTLEEIAHTNGDSFYKGELAKAILQHSKLTGGVLCAEDLANYKAQWVDPISVNYKGYDIWEIPPNGQGMLALMALKILEKMPLEQRDSTLSFHRQIEAMKLAYVDGQRYITQEDMMDASVKDMLSDRYADQRRALISDTAMLPKPGKPQAGGTVYLACADEEGNMVSFIQSNYHDFGSRVVVPNTGICLQNRGRGFSLDSTAANYFQGGKKPLHTIIPAFITKDNQAIAAFGVMGGFMQPQGHVQMVTNMIDFKLNPQAALDAPRWQWMKDREITLEHAVPINIAKGLAKRAHQVKVCHDSEDFGRGQIILRDPDSGVLLGGTEARADGYIAAY
ncbi:MAG: gamma-glutamyltranspeptidase/glutathione hydrolase [Oceanospirillaceae bacterium]|jgi:gamma-glutamyltranspeptidase/glutathione hydrolase